MVCAVDADPLETPPREVAAIVRPAASDSGARAKRYAELCEEAASTDYLYLAGLLVLNVGGGVALGVTKESGSPFVRTLGPAAVGVTWGGLLGGGYLALPKCRPGRVLSSAPEGSSYSAVPMALAMGLVSAATAPVVVAIQAGQVREEWTTEERVARVLTASATGFAGALLPYLIAPKPWRAASQLRAFAEVESSRALVGVRMQF